MSQPKRVAVYRRVSSADQNLDMQRQELDAFLRRVGWEVVVDLEEKVSSLKEKRPMFEQVMKAATRRLVDAVVVWRIDRVGRNTLELLKILEQLHAVDVAFITVQEGYDTTTPMGKLLFSFSAIMAEHERDLIRERTVSGVRAAQARGVHCGRPPAKRPELEAVRTAIQAHGSMQAAGTALGCSEWTIRRVLQAAKSGDAFSAAS